MLLEHLRAMSLNPSIKALTDSSFFCLVSSSVATATSKSLSKNQAKKMPLRLLKVLIDPGWSFINQSKANPLREATKSLVISVSLGAMFPI